MMAVAPIAARRVGRPRGPAEHTGNGHGRRFDESTMANYCLALARNLRTIRIERHIPLAELAAASGVNVTTLCELEAGISRIRGQRRRGRNMINPQFFTIVRVAVALGVSPSEVMP